MAKRTTVTEKTEDGKNTFLKPNISEFGLWFEGQFGKPVMDQDEYFELEKEREHKLLELSKITKKINDYKLYNQQRKAASYAWFGLMAIQDERKSEPYPKCPECGKNDDVIKNGTVERKGKKVQNWHCKACKKTW